VFDSDGSTKNTPLCECGRWAEITEDAEKRRKGPPWRRRTESKWTWLLKRPDPIMPFGFSVAASGSAWSYLDALRAAIEKHDWWHDWDRRQAEQRTINFGGER
jgi:hypothetical protein